MKKEFAAAVLTALLLTGCRNNLNWNEIVLSGQIPLPDASTIKVNSNTKYQLLIDIDNISVKEFYDYIEECKSNDFLTECDEYDTSFSAFNSNGYKLTLQYYPHSNQMSLQLEAPLQLDNLKWETYGLREMLPVPNSNIGTILSDTENQFSAYIGDTNRESFNKYVSQCRDLGFVNNFNNSNNFYYGGNSDGYYLTIRYIGNNVVFLKINLLK